jgi:transcriptional regulator with XRE-family HTH domain
MSNLALRKAMAEANLTERQLAQFCSVDMKTVARWLSDNSRMPHPRHRFAAANALGVDETMLWPDTLKNVIKIGPQKEIVEAFPFRSNCAPSTWGRLIASAQTELLFGGYTSYFVWLEQANLGRLLKAKAQSGAKVRFLLGDPESPATRKREEQEKVPLTVSTRIRVTLDELSKLQGTENIEARFVTDEERHLGISVFRFDQEMIVCSHLAHLAGHDSPTYHLQRKQTDGLFDRYVFHVESMWAAARPITDRPEQLLGPQ